MRQQFRRVDGDRRRPYFQMMMEVFRRLFRLQLVHRLDDMAILLDVQHHRDRRLDEHLVLMDVLQNLDELNLDANLPCQDVVLLLVDVRLDAMVVVLVVVALVGAELRQLRMDYFRHVVGAEDLLCHQRPVLQVLLVRMAAVQMVL
jgi:hypothetical protein